MISRKGGYYCDCIESSKSQGLRIPKTAKQQGQMNQLVQVVVSNEERCTHCGYIAMFHLKPPIDKKD